MNKSEFIAAMEQRLLRLPKSERDEILNDFEVHFVNGLAEGRTEEEISAELGDPAELSAVFLDNLPEGSKGAAYVPPAPDASAPVVQNQPPQQKQPPRQVQPYPQGQPPQQRRPYPQGQPRQGQPPQQGRPYPPGQPRPGQPYPQGQPRQGQPGYSPVWMPPPPKSDSSDIAAVALRIIGLLALFGVFWTLLGGLIELPSQIVNLFILGATTMSYGTLSASAIIVFAVGLVAVFVLLVVLTIICIKLAIKLITWLVDYNKKTSGNKTTGGII